MRSPAHPGGREIRLRIKPNQPQSHTMLFSRERQAARGSKVERTRIAGNLPNHTSEITAAQPLLQREQSILRRSGFHMDDPLLQVLRQACTIRPATETNSRAILNPEDPAYILAWRKRIRLRILGLLIQRIAHQGKRQPRPTRFAGFRKDLAMQRCSKPRPPTLSNRGVGGQRG